MAVGPVGVMLVMLPADAVPVSGEVVPALTPAPPAEPETPAPVEPLPAFTVAPMPELPTEPAAVPPSDPVPALTPAPTPELPTEPETPAPVEPLPMLPDVALLPLPTLNPPVPRPPIPPPLPWSLAWACGGTNGTVVDENPTSDKAIAPPIVSMIRRDWNLMTSSRDYEGRSPTND